MWSNEGFVINVWFKLVNIIIHSKMKVVNNKNNFKMVTIARVIDFIPIADENRDQKYNVN